MKKILLLLFFIPVVAFGQQLNNSGMENWTNYGASNEEPSDWNSFMTAGGTWSGTAAQQIRRSNVIRPGSTGTYSAVIWSRSVLGVVANGNMTTGKINMGSTSPANSNNYNATVTSDANFNEAITGSPDSLVFWVKFKPVNAASQGRVRSVLHDSYNYRDPSGSDPSSPNHVVSDATLNFPTTSNVWVRKSIPFNHTGPATTPAYMLVTFTTNMTPGGGNANDSLWIDDISLVYNPVLTTGTINPLVYYVSASTGAAVSVPYTVTGTVNNGNIFTAQLSNASGSFGSPVNIGTVSSTTSGTINATIPAGTASGTGYRIRTTGSNYTVTGSTNTSDIQVILVSNSVAPSTTQTIQVNTNGTLLTVTESAGTVSREWKYATSPGGPYNSFPAAQTTSTYTPNFASTGTYYVVCETTYPNGLIVTSNETIINVVGNSVAPSSTQSILVSVNGTTLTVTETPAGTAREWKFSTISGGPYNSFGIPQTGMTYTPNFASTGTYYVVCISTISSVICTSNEVEINVSNTTLTTGTVTGSPFLFSPNAPDASVTVPYTVSSPFGAGNTFTAQLSDASGSFAAPVNIGSVSAVNSGSINATIPHTTPAGTGYRIRVVGTTPSLSGSDNGTDLVVDQFNNSVSPSTTQTIVYNTNGTAITATESQSATRNWKYATVSGGPYTAFMAPQTGVSYTPNFPAPGTYYVVSVSKNTYNDTTISNEVEIDVTNGTTINTSAVSSSPFYLSPNAVVAPTINFTSDIIFNGGNTFTVEISDATGSFAAPVVIGSATSNTVVPISATIPNSLPNGSNYRIRVNSSSPAATGTDNGAGLSVVQFETNIAPADTQYIGSGVNGNTITVTPTHPTGVTNEWKFKTGISPFGPFSPAQTGTTYVPNFVPLNAYYVTCYSVNQWNDTVQSGTVLIYVTDAGIEGTTNNGILVNWNNEQLNVNLTQSTLHNPVLEILNINGQVIHNQLVIGGSNNVIYPQLTSGVYICRISEGNISFSQKFVKP